MSGESLIPFAHKGHPASEVPPEVIEVQVWHFQWARAWDRNNNLDAGAELARVRKVPVWLVRDDVQHANVSEWNGAPLVLAKIDIQGNIVQKWEPPTSASERQPWSGVR